MSDLHRHQQVPQLQPDRLEAMIRHAVRQPQLEAAWSWARVGALLPTPRPLLVGGSALVAAGVLALAVLLGQNPTPQQQQVAAAQTSANSLGVADDLVFEYEVFLLLDSVDDADQQGSSAL